MQVRFIAVLSEPAEPEAELSRPAGAAGVAGQNDGASAGHNGGVSDAAATTGGNGDSVMEEADLLGMDDGDEPAADAAPADAAEPEASEQSAASASTPTGDAPPANGSAAGADPAAAAADDATATAAAPAADPSEAPAAEPANPPAAAAEAEARLPGRRRLTLVLRYVVNPASLLPLYSATVDMDLHPHLGQPLKVQTLGAPHTIAAVAWSDKRHSLARMWRGSR